MTKQEFREEIGDGVTEKMMKVADLVYRMKNNPAEPVFLQMWKDEETRTEMLMDGVIDLSEEKAVLERKNDTLKEEIEKLKAENAQLKEERNSAAYQLIDESRGGLVRITEEDKAYEAATAILGRRESVLYCLRENYALSEKDKKWLMRRL